MKARETAYEDTVKAMEQAISRQPPALSPNFVGRSFRRVTINWQSSILRVTGKIVNRQSSIL